MTVGTSKKPKSFEKKYVKILKKFEIAVDFQEVWMYNRHIR